MWDTIVGRDLAYSLSLYLSVYTVASLFVIWSGEAERTEEEGRKGKGKGKE